MSGTRCPDDGTTLIPLQGARDRLVGRVLADRFTLKERLGVGGMGVVYRGLQLSVGREVAIKVLNTNIVTEPDAIKRFLREAKLTSRLFHPNAVATLDFGRTEDGLFFLVMELAHGRTLREVLDDEGKLSVARVVRIGAQICDALAAAHDKGIVHRDLKPANIMVSGRAPDGDQVKVFDFGVAKSLRADATRVTSAGTVLGTPMYLPPEVARGEDVDGRSDIYSLGAILYEMASGRPPFQTTTLARLIAMHAESIPEPIADVPKAISDAILAFLAKLPDDRPRDATAARALLLKAARTPILPADPEPAASISAPRKVDPIADVEDSIDDDDATTMAEPLAPIINPRPSIAETLLNTPVRSRGDSSGGGASAPGAPRGKGRPPSEGIAPAVEDTRQDKAAQGEAADAKNMVSTGEWMSFGDNDELLADEVEGEKWRRALRIGIPAAVFLVVAVLGLWGMSGDDETAAAAGSDAGVSEETMAATAPADDDVDHPGTESVAPMPEDEKLAPADAATPRVTQEKEAQERAVAQAEKEAQERRAQAEKEAQERRAQAKKEAQERARAQARKQAQTRAREKAQARAREKAQERARARERQRARERARARERERNRDRKSREGSSDLPF